MSVPLQPRMFANADNVGRIVHVPSTAIRWSQEDLNDEKVDQMADAMKRNKRMPPPVGSYKNGVFTVHDGHHRIAAAMKLGKRTLQVKVM